MPTPKTDCKLCFLVRQLETIPRYSGSGETKELTIVVRALVPDNASEDTHLGRLETVTAFPWDHPARLWEDFAVHQYLEAGAARCYGDPIRFQTCGNFANGKDVERWAKAAKKVEAGLQKIREKRGYTADFAEVVSRIGEVIGVRHWALYRDAESWRHTGYRWQLCDPGDGVNALRRLLDEALHPRQTALAAS